MTLSEFKAWFEGFTENLGDAPTKVQFDKIKAKVAEITGTPITHTVYVDRYVQPYRQYWDRVWTMGNISGGVVPLSYSSLAANPPQNGMGAVAFEAALYAAPNDFNGEDAMRALGRVEASIQ